MQILSWNIIESKIQKSLIRRNIVFSYDYKLVCVDDKFTKLFKTYLGEDAVCNFINSMIEENKYCSEVIKKSILTKNL